MFIKETTRSVFGFLSSLIPVFRHMYGVSGRGTLTLKCLPVYHVLVTLYACFSLALGPSGSWLCGSMFCSRQVSAITTDGKVDTFDASIYVLHVMSLRESSQHVQSACTDHESTVVFITLALVRNTCTIALASVQEQSA